VGLIGLVPSELFAHPGWWAKFGYTALLVAALAWLASRLARPASGTAAPQGALAAILGLAALLGALALADAPPGRRVAEWLGHSSLGCPFSVFALSLPALAAVMWALRGLAPTRLRAAGLAGGLLAGALGALGYALSCSEVSMAFVATWYSLGIVTTGVIGALLGPRLLRW